MKLLQHTGGPLAKVLAALLIWLIMTGAACPWTTKMATEDPTNKPLSDPVWGDVGSFTLNAGDKIWFGISNIYVQANTKKATLRLDVTDGDKLEISDVYGYFNNGNSTSTTYGYRGPTSADGGWEWSASIRPQPSWEVFELIYPGKHGDRASFTVTDDRGSSGCDESSSSTHTFSVETGSANDSEEDPFRVTEIWYFPTEVSIAEMVEFEPRFSAPPSTGEWFWEYVYADPYGEPRDSGGVRFYTAGPGIASDDPAHTYSVFFGVMGMEQWFDVYFWDATNGEWIGFYSWQKVPALTEWGLLVLAALLLISALWVYRNKRRPRLTAQ